MFHERGGDALEGRRPALRRAGDRALRRAGAGLQEAGGVLRAVHLRNEKLRVPIPILT